MSHVEGQCRIPSRAEVAGVNRSRRDEQGAEEEGGSSSESHDGLSSKGEEQEMERVRAGLREAKEGQRDAGSESETSVFSKQPSEGE